MTSSNQERRYYVKSYFFNLYDKYFCQVSVGLNKRWRSDIYFKLGSFYHFYNPQRKDDAKRRHCRFDPDSLCRKISILTESNSVQNLSSLMLKAKEGGGGGKHPVLIVLRGLYTDKILALNIISQTIMAILSETSLRMFDSNRSTR